MWQRHVLRVVTAGQREQWDAFISAQPSGHLLQSWGWGELKANANWHPLRLALWDTEQEAIAAAAQVLRRTVARIPLPVGHLAYIPKGPVLDWSYCGATVPHSTGRSQGSPLLDAKNEGVQDVPLQFLIQLNAYLGRHGALALQVEPGYVECDSQSDNPVEESKRSIVECLKSQNFHPARPIQPVRTIMLDLTPDEDTLLARMKEKWRYNVRLAGRKGVKVRIARTLEDVRSWYELLQVTSQRDHFGIHTLDYYLRAWQIFVPRNQAQLFLAEYEGRLLAGIFVGLYAKQAIYLYGASSNEQRSLMPNYLLQWEAIRWAKSEGAKQYDFWGISETDNADEALSGVSRFKSGWGGEVIRFAGNYERVYRPILMRAAKRFLPM